MGDRLHQVLFRSDQNSGFHGIGLKWEKDCDLSSSFIFDWFVFSLAMNKDNHKILDGFEIRQDPTRDCRVSWP